MCLNCYTIEVNIVNWFSVITLLQHVYFLYNAAIVLLHFIGHVWSLQHLCRLAIRKCLGIRKRRYIKELPLPQHLVSFLMSLPLDCSKTLHENWDRIRTNTPNKQKSKPSRDGSKFDSGASLQALKTGTDSVFY